MKLKYIFSFLLSLPLVLAVDNVAGWDLLLNGSIIGGVAAMYDNILAGWLWLGLYILFEFMILIKTRNIALNFLTSAMFAGLVYKYPELIPTGSELIIATILVLSLAGIVYKYFFRKDA